MMMNKMGTKKITEKTPKHCIHCASWKDKELNPRCWIDGKTYVCKKTLKHIDYYDCCKEFELEGD